MKKGYIVLIVIGVIILAIFLWFRGSYNGMVKMSETVSAQWSNVENQYQRRLDLIPNLVNTVKGYAAHEQQTLTDVVNARAKATQTQINFEQLDEASMQRLNRTQGELSSALSRLMAISESYPDLKANTNFTKLQDELSETENKISYARQFYNDSVMTYKNKLEMFPSNIIASIFGFKEKPFFEASENEKENVKVIRAYIEKTK